MTTHISNGGVRHLGFLAENVSLKTTNSFSTSTAFVHRSKTVSMVLNLVQLNICGIVCVFLQRGKSGDGCFLSVDFVDMNGGW